MVDDYALLAKLRDLDTAIEQAEYWLEQYKRETVSHMRQSAMRFYMEYRVEALKLMRIVANHGKGE